MLGDSPGAKRARNVFLSLVAAFLSAGICSKETHFTR